MSDEMFLGSAHEMFLGYPGLTPSFHSNHAGLGIYKEGT